MINEISQVIFDKKGFNIFAIDVRGISTLTDYMIIAEGNVDRHVVAIGKEIIDELKDKGERPIYTEGFEAGDWVVIDYGNIMIHLFTPGLREKYQLERLFPQGKIVDVDLKT